MARLYDLQDQLIAIENILEANTNEETAEILESAKIDLMAAINNKVENIIDFMDDCKAKVGQLKDREAALAQKRKTLENKIDYLRNMVLWYMKNIEKTKETFGDWNVTVAKTAGKVVLDIPEEDVPLYFKHVVYTVDKNAIKQNMIAGKACVVLDSGESVQVAHIEEGESLRIK